MGPIVTRFDVSDVVGEQASLAATYYPARTGTAAGVVLVCLPGGTYNRDYWDLAVPGYSFAEFATENGYAVVTIDPLDCLSDPRERAQMYVPTGLDSGGRCNVCGRV
jgi:hypothetical protein